MKISSGCSSVLILLGDFGSDFNFDVNPPGGNILFAYHLPRLMLFADTTLVVFDIVVE